MNQQPAKSHKGISVSRLTARLKALINYDPSLQNQWVVAELTEVRGSGGHVYLELAEKDDSGNIVAKIRGTIWASVATRMKEQYGVRMRELMRVGNEVLLFGSLSYSPLYALGFNILDIDPSYQRDTSRLQAQIIATLTSEGILDANKGLSLCDAPQRIAVISAPGAAGYGDFVNQLLRNPYRLRFLPTLFAATMQGQYVSATVRNALNEIEQRADEFDCVVIIRGGGATTDLVGFDDVQLARAVALFPLPVIVGIGHERDNTVLDFIAHTRVKTPTAAAEFLVARNADVLAQVTNLVNAVASYAQKVVFGEKRQLEFYEDKIPSLARNRAEHSKSRLNEITAALPLLVQGRLHASAAQLDAASRAIEAAGQRRIATEQMRLSNARTLIERDLQTAMAREDNRLQTLADKVHLLSPQNVLARGYSITRLHGKALRNAKDITPGTRITTHLQEGEITSVIE